MIGPSSGLRGYHSASAEFAWLGCSCHCRTAMIRAGEQRPGFAGRFPLLHLCRDCRSVRFMGVRHLLRSRPNRDSALAAIERNVGSIVDDDRAVHVDVRDGGGIYVHHGGVVKELSAAPFAAIKSVAAVTEAIVNAAVESNLRSPVTGIPGIGTVIPAPISGRP